MFTGCEGLLGVIVEVTVKLLPLLDRAQTALAAFDDVAKAGSAVAEIIWAGISTAGLELRHRGGPHRLGRAGTRHVLEETQGRFSGSGVSRSGLLLHGWHHPAEVPARDSAAHRRVIARLRFAAGQCLSIRRRQSSRFI